MAMLPDTAKHLVYDLTIEYVRQNNTMNGSLHSMENTIKEIADVSKKIEAAVENNYHEFKLF